MTKRERRKQSDSLTQLHKERAMAIHTTYGDMRRAFMALGEVAGGQSLPGKISLSNALRIKRTMGVMRPLYEDLGELEEELMKKDGWDRKAQMSPELSNKLKELHKSEVEVGVEPFTVQDLGLPEEVPTSVIGVLYNLGPFFADKEGN